MIDSFLKLIDFFTKLIELRQKRGDRFFESVVEPCFKHTESIYNDYLELLHSTKRTLSEESDLEDVIRHLEDGRIKFLSVRMKIRSVVTPYLKSQFHAHISAPDNAPDAQTLFCRGVAGVLRGGLAPFEDGGQIPDTYRNQAYHELQEPRHTPDGIVFSPMHTLLDTIYALSNLPVEESRTTLTGLMDRQIRSITLAWQDVVDSFHLLQAENIKNAV